VLQQKKKKENKKQFVASHTTKAGKPAEKKKKKEDRPVVMTWGYKEVEEGRGRETAPYSTCVRKQKRRGGARKPMRKFHSTGKKKGVFITTGRAPSPQGEEKGEGAVALAKRTNRPHH